ncbi:hypothetical protein Tco_0393558 [Tanacetum coccineum]
MVSNQIRPPGFFLRFKTSKSFQSKSRSNFNQNQGTNFNQNRGSNFNQGQVYQPPTNQPPVYQAPSPQMQGVSKTDFENYVKANDAVLRNMQNQGQGLQNQMTNLTKMLSKFISSNTALSSSSSNLPSQTITNPREYVNAITTRSGKTCEGPSTPYFPTSVVSTPLKEPKRNPETSMDKVKKPSSESTAQVPPPEDQDSIFIEIPKPKAKKTIQEPNSLKPTSYQPKLPYPKRMKVREKDTPSAKQSSKNKQFAHAISVIDFSKDEPFSGSTTNHFDALPPSSSPVKTSDNPEEFADELTLLKKGQYIEIDAFLAMEVSSNFEEGYYDSEGDVIFLKSLLNDDTTHNLSPEVISDHEPKQNESIHDTLITFSPRSDPLHHEFADNSTFLPENESSILEPSALRPPPETTDVKIHLEPDTAMKNDEDFNQGEIVLSLNVEDVNSFTFVIWTFLPFFTYPEDSPFILSLRSEDLVFDPGIFIFHFSYLEPVVFSMEVSYSKYCSP